MLIIIVLLLYHYLYFHVVHSVQYYVIYVLSSILHPEQLASNYLLIVPFVVERDNQVSMLKTPGRYIELLELYYLHW